MEKNELKTLILSARRARFGNNFYSMDVLDHLEDFWIDGKSFLFSYDDHGIKRLIYFTERPEDLDLLLKKVVGTYYLEYLTENPSANCPEADIAARMKRLSNADCRSVFNEDSPVLVYQDETIGQQAETEDAHAINEILWSVFHTEISHLLTDEELAGRISEGQFTVHKTDGRIDALLQADIMPKKFYINQIVNQTDKKIIHALLLNKLKKYTDQGGKYLYAWVDETNVASMKFHGKYGMHHDGMWSLIYRIEREK